MPRTVQEILDHADELAKRFDDYEPPPARSVSRRRSSRCVTPSSRDPRRSARSRLPLTTLARAATRGCSSAPCWAPPEKPRVSATEPGKKRRLGRTIGRSACGTSASCTTPATSGRWHRSSSAACSVATQQRPHSPGPTSARAVRHRRTDSGRSRCVEEVGHEGGRRGVRRDGRIRDTGDACLGRHVRGQARAGVVLTRPASCRTPRPPSAGSALVLVQPDPRAPRDRGSASPWSSCSTSSMRSRCSSSSWRKKPVTISRYFSR